jgi:hypothetical protein
VKDDAGRVLYVLDNDTGYSVTTTGRHTPALRGALRGLPYRVVKVYNVPRGGRFARDHADTITGICTYAQKMEGKAKRARSNRSWWADKAVDALADARFLADAHGIAFKGIEEHLAMLEREREGRQVWTNMGRFFEQYARASEEVFDRPLRAIGDVLAGLTWLAGGHRKVFPGAPAEYHFRANVYRREYPYELPTLLRVNGDTVETSRGAEFPLEHGLKALPIITMAAQGRRTFGFTSNDANGPRLGHFRVDAIECDGTVRAGCHTVPLFAIRWAARAAGACDAPELEHVAQHVAALSVSA